MDADDTNLIVRIYDTALDPSIWPNLMLRLAHSEISDIRSRSLDTVKSQMKTLMRKTNSATRTDLVHMIHNLSSTIGYQVER